MKFKTAIAAFLTLTAAFTVTAFAKTPDSGVVRETDIVTFIDGSPIESYNYNDYTYVVAEDLANYGFDVKWDGEKRELAVTREKFAFSPYAGTFVNEKKTDKSSVGAAKFSVYPTDIKTYVNGEKSDAYNINGKTIINTDWLGLFGSCSYDDILRRYDVKILENEISACEQRQTTEEDNTYGYNRTVTQKGIFDGDELTYGIKKDAFQNKYGEIITTEYGDFKNGKTIKSIHSFRLFADVTEYRFSAPIQLTANGYADEVNQNSVVYCIQSAGFKYGFAIQCISPAGDSGKQVVFNDTGKFYLIRDFDTDSEQDDGTPKLFDGILFGDDGSPVYEGKMRLDTLSFLVGNAQYGNSKKKFEILYAPGYSAENGRIYYFTQDPRSDYNVVYGKAFYEGSVVNGVAHGKGAIYDVYGTVNGEERAIKLYNREGSPQYDTVTAKNDVIYTGDFADGLPNGEGTMYDGGFPVSVGTWKNGKKNGHFTEYTGFSEDEMYLIYDGNFTNDSRDGYGTEYNQKGYANYEGVYKRFVGEWKDNSWYNGKWYETEYDSATNTHSVYLNYEGEFRYDGPQYGTDYRYYNEQTGQYEVKTGWFRDWKFLRE